jgi:very-short-patch-repair endonuclease
MVELPSLLVRSDLLARGVRKDHIDTELRSKRWVRIHDGLYVVAHASNDDRQRIERLAHLHRGGELSILSHDTAAEIHGFDRTTAYDGRVFLTVQAGTSGVSYPGLVVRRSRLLARNRRVEVDGFAVTARSHTVLDLAAQVEPIELERIAESAIRGVNPRRPDLWRTQVLLELAEFAAGDHRVRGARQLSVWLTSRPAGCRPTGSIAETAIVQALRELGIVDVIRQASLRVTNDDGTKNDFFPDLLIPRRRLIVEVDGAAHLDARRHRADLQRQNKLLLGFNLLRCSGSQALFDAPTFAREALQYPEIDPQGTTFSWTTRNRVVSGNGLRWTANPHGRPEP